MSNSDKKRYLILKDPNIYKGLIILAVPIMLNNFIKTIHDLVDMYFVSNFTFDQAYQSGLQDGLSESAAEVFAASIQAASVGAIQITFPVLWIFISIGMGISIAGTALISQYVGANQREDARHYATNLFVIAFAMGILLNAIIYFGAPLFMRLVGAEDTLFLNSVKYLQIRSFEVLFVFIFFAFQSIRQADGDTITPVVYGVITMVLNIILSPLFIVFFEQGVEGAAYATLLSQVVIIPFILIQSFRSKTGITISYKLYSISRNIITGIVRMAIPASMGQAITAIGFMVMTGFIISYGDATVASFGVGNRISSMILHPVMAIGGVMAAYIGQNIGNLNPERARDTFKKGLILSVGTMIVLSSILLLIREDIALIFWEPNTESLDLTVRYLFFLLIGLPLMAVYQAFIGVFNGTGNTNYTFIVSVTRLWFIRLPLIYLLGRFTNMGSSSIWTAMLISNFIIAFIAFFFYLRVDFKPKAEIDI